LDGAFHEVVGLGVTADLAGAEDIIAHHDGLGKEGGSRRGIGGYDGGLGKGHFGDRVEGRLDTGDGEGKGIEVTEASMLKK
jgi:hypothetical protein